MKKKDGRWVDVSDFVIAMLVGLSREEEVAAPSAMAEGVDGVVGRRLMMLLSILSRLTSESD
jgi:hypothetical protein